MDRNGEKHKNVFLIDGHSFLYRAFYATPYLSNSKGMPTNAIYGFIIMLKRLIEEHKPDSLVVVFDSAGPSFRENIFNQYKAQRPSMPDNLSIQIPYLKRIIQAMGLPCFEKEGYEADDVIGTIISRLKTHNVHLYIATGDKDMMQLVGGNVFIVDTMKNQLIGEKEVIDKFGVKPELIVDYLALCGDPSDNIPGVPGIGEKTARELVNTHGPIEKIYSEIDTLKKRAVKERLLSGKELAFMSRQLAMIKTDVPIDIDFILLKKNEADEDTLRSLYRELEFASLYREMKKEQSEVRQVLEKGFSEIVKGRLALMVKLQRVTSNEHALEGFAVYDGEGIYISKNQNELFELINSESRIITYNLKPILLYLYKTSADSGGKIGVPSPIDTDRFFDTMLASYLINPLRKDFNLDTLVEEFLEIGISKSDCNGFLKEGVQTLFRLEETLSERLKNDGLYELFYTVEMPLTAVLAQMESIGVKVDRVMLNELSRDFDRRLNQIMKTIYNLSGEPFNINSPQQLSKILFEKLGLQPIKKTKTGFSTDTEVLETLSIHHPLPGEILRYRTLSKLKNTYVDVLPTLINPKTGRVHTSFNQMVVATGRLSSSDPNLQNIPVRGEEGRKIREAFVPEGGFTLLSSDYSQIELRILAHLSNDRELIDAFLKGEDIHTKVACEVFGVTPEGVTSEMRRTAKVINFGIIYGMSGYGLAKELNISQREAQAYIDGYFALHKGVREYIDRVIEEGRKNGYVRTMFGRIRLIPEINNPDPAVRQLGERTAMNTPIQGTAADIIKIAMINIEREIRRKGLLSRLILQIHDELLFEVKDEELNIMEQMVKEKMEHAAELSIPLKVSIGKGKNWAEAHS
ncbi:MAG: DNA polymerase I [Syntrophorhabdaceae bacterium]|nr:DNA polymerase I [Syntrophorhabdaceae bacterium]